MIDYYKEHEQAVQNVVQRAFNNDHSSFEFVRSNLEYRGLLKYTYGVSVVIMQFNKAHKLAIKEYIKALEKDKDELEMILLIKKYEEVLIFYKEELKILKSMVEEFKAYKANGHRIDMLLGAVRSDDEMFDFRVGKIDE